MNRLQELAQQALNENWEYEAQQAIWSKLTIEEKTEIWHSQKFEDGQTVEISFNVRNGEKVWRKGKVVRFYINYTDECIHPIPTYDVHTDTSKTVFQVTESRLRKIGE